MSTKEQTGSVPVRRGLPRRKFAVSAALCAVAVAASACGTQGVYAIPLPGGADTGENPLNITVDFADVVDLVPQSAVKVDGVTVGKVLKIELAPNGWDARTSLVLRSDVDLPANAVAHVKQTNLLGEKYVEIDAPETNPSPKLLQSGDTIPIQNTGTGAQVEDVLGALSMLLNGGGVAQLQPIIEEMNKAVGGREPEVRALFEQFTKLVAGIDEQRDDITRAFDSLNTLSGTVLQQREQIDGVLNELPEGVAILAEQTPQFLDMLTQLERLGDVGSGVINQTRDDVIANLRALRPTLEALGESAPALVGALPILPTFPIPDEILPAVKGGYANVYVILDLRLGQALDNLGVGAPDPVYVKPYGDHQVPVDLSNPWIMGNGPRAGWPTVSLLPTPDAAPPFDQRVGAALPLGLDQLLPAIPGLEPASAPTTTGEGGN
ncbi:MCE family protein [Tomitella biformata]|uniref:MCE family protein n=1 Tax=Tomitella biformata TaxID=630403 RepID=UPI0004B24C14|nr:MCE family protein [Tomitella biformata]